MGAPVPRHVGRDRIGARLRDRDVRGGAGARFGAVLCAIRRNSSDPPSPTPSHLQELNQSNYINIWLAMAVTYNLMNLGMNIIRMWKPTAPLALMVGNVVFDLVKWLVLAFMFVLIPFSIGMDVLYGADGIESCQEDQGVPAGEGNWRVLSALLFLFQTMVNAEGAYGCLWKSEPSMGDIELANGLAGVVLLVVFHAIVVFLLITMLVRRSPAQFGALPAQFGAIL